MGPPYIFYEVIKPYLHLLGIGDKRPVACLLIHLSRIAVMLLQSDARVPGNDNPFYSLHEARKAEILHQHSKCCMLQRKVYDCTCLGMQSTLELQANLD